MAGLLGSLSNRLNVLDGVGSDLSRRSDTYGAATGLGPTAADISRSDYHSGYGGSSGYGHGGYGGKKECCELVVDPLAFLTMLAFIGAGTAFLNVQITMILGRKKRRRRGLNGDAEEQTLFGGIMDVAQQGRLVFTTKIVQKLT